MLQLQLKNRNERQYHNKIVIDNIKKDYESKIIYLFRAIDFRDKYFKKIFPTKRNNYRIIKIFKCNKYIGVENFPKLIKKINYKSIEPRILV